MEFTGYYMKSHKMSTNGMHRFAVSTDYVDIDRPENGCVPAEGYIFALPEKTKILVKGYWDDKERIFKAEKVIPSTENNKLSIKLIKDVAEELKKDDSTLKIPRNFAKKVSEAAEEDILAYVKSHYSTKEIKEKLPEDIHYLTDLIWPKLRRSLSTAYDVIPYLAELGIAPVVSVKLAEKYGPSALRRLRKHPFKTGAEAGLGFAECDKIAAHENADPLSEERICAAGYEIMKNAAQSEGSTYLTLDELYEGVRGLLLLSRYPDEKVSYMFFYLSLSGDKRFFIEEKGPEIRVALRYYRSCEIKALRHIRRLNSKSKEVPDIASYINEFESSEGIRYNERQRNAVALGTTAGIKIITGGPGTGKTTVIKGLIYVYTKLNKKGKIALCAPTGRAAQRMSDVVKGIKATTVHKALDIKLFDTDKIMKDENNPIDASLIIVDEVSMMDIELFSDLLAAIKDDSVLLLVGDSDQLKSVGPGNVLHDMLDSKKFQTVALTSAYRQKGDSTITENAHKILAGDAELKTGSDFIMETYLDTKDAADRVKELFLELYDENDPMKTQILSDVKKDELGTVSINRTVREELFPDEQGLTKGDKVILVRNNYNEGYYNGDMGIVYDVNPDHISVSINGNLTEVSKENKQDIKSAYAITIHKSQGSEYDNIIVALPAKPVGMLTRNLLYTAITRAKKKVYIISTGDALEKAVKTVPLEKIKTGFALMLKGK